MNSAELARVRAHSHLFLVWQRSSVEFGHHAHVADLLYSHSAHWVWLYVGHLQIQGMCNVHFFYCAKYESFIFKHFLLFQLCIIAQTMAIDCAHYMAQFIWVIGKFHHITLSLRILATRNIVSSSCLQLIYFFVFFINSHIPIFPTGNAAWAIGEIFTIPGGVDDDKGPYSVWHP